MLKCYKYNRISHGSNLYELITKLYKIKIQLMLDVISITTEPEKKRFRANRRRNIKERRIEGPISENKTK